MKVEFEKTNHQQCFYKFGMMKPIDCGRRQSPLKDLSKRIINLRGEDF